MAQSFENFIYDELSHLQVGRIGEYWVKIWLTLSSFEVYHNDVDDKGIDFIVRLNDERHIDIQVKTIRVEKTNYVYVNKETWENKKAKTDGLRENLYLALVLLENNEMPSIFLIPSLVWRTPNNLFKDRNYNKEGQKSKPEWGIYINSDNLELLKSYDINNFINTFKGK